MRVLIADDNRDWADGLGVLLTEEGYRVRVAYDGLEAIETARSFQPEVVVIDIRMPRLGGREAARIFRRHPPHTRPKLIAVTAWPADAGEGGERMAGFDRFLTKPAEPGEILEILKDLEPR
jgi:CheY-like chemotaxis protein